MNAAPASIPPTTPRSAAMLRRIGLLPRCRLARRCLLLRGARRLLGCGRLPRRDCLLLRLGLWLHVAQGRLEVVEDEPGRRIVARRRRDDGLAVPHHEDTALAGRDLELCQRAFSGLQLFGAGEEPPGCLRELVSPRRFPERGGGDLPS